MDDGWAWTGSGGAFSGTSALPWSLSARLWILRWMMECRRFSSFPSGGVQRVSRGKDPVLKKDGRIGGSERIRQKIIKISSTRSHHRAHTTATTSSNKMELDQTISSS